MKKPKFPIPDDASDAHRRQVEVLNAMLNPSVVGSLYVIAFSTGIVKLGRAKYAQKRIAQHRREAARYGVHVLDAWMSSTIKDCDEAEARALARLARAYPIAIGREYFHAPFDTVVGVAKSAVER
jgi:hypothetical protein